MAADFTQFPIETATITERVASNPATLPLAGTEGLLIDQGGTTKGATAAAIAATLPEATTTDAGKLSAGDKTKIDSIASNATANASDDELRDRATHTGEQAISTVTGCKRRWTGRKQQAPPHQLNQQRSAQQRQTRPQRLMQLNQQRSAQQRQTRPQRPMQLNQHQRSSDRRDHKGQCSSISSNGIGPCRPRRY
jgi:hypothetical protein